MIIEYKNILISYLQYLASDILSGFVKLDTIDFILICECRYEYASASIRSQHHANIGMHKSIE